MDMNPSYGNGVPLISVLLPISRLDEYFELALDSVLSQTFNNFEVLVLANGLSSEESEKIVEICKKDKRVFLHKLDVRGLMFALNYGIQISRAEFIARMDADDISYPDRFKLQLDFFQSNPDVGVVGGRIDLIDGSGRILNKCFRFFENHVDIARVLPYRNPLCHPALMFRRESLLNVWGYRYGFMSEDHEMFIRMLHYGIKFHNIREFIFAYRRHSNQITNSNKARAHFAEIASFMWINFYNTKNVFYIFGAIAVYPPVRQLRNSLTSLLLKLKFR